MAKVVLRLRLTSGDHLDVVYEEESALDEAAVLEHVIATLATDSGVLRATHDDRLLVVYGRAVATVEVAPRGAVL